MHRILLITALIVLIAAMLKPVFGHDWTRPEFAQLNQYQRNWMQKQKRPGTNFFCCSEADGDQVDEEIRYDEKGIGHYYINSAKTRGQWLKVPEEAIIREPNLHGRAIAWFRWTSADGKTGSTMPRDDLPIVMVFCFMPGPLF